MIRDILSYILDLAYPRKCLLCREILPFYHKDFLCEDCRREIPFLEQPVCQKCGMKVAQGDTLCYRCQKESFAFERNISPFDYRCVREAIKHFKFRCFKGDAGPLAQLMVEYIERYSVDFSHIDAVIPVPLHPKKRKIRGFNQTELLARELCRLTGLHYGGDVLERVKNTVPQSQLNHGQRSKNIQSAFAVASDAQVEGLRFLMIDDIFTTGSTLNECAKTLYRSGAKEVYTFTLSVVCNEE